MDTIFYKELETVVDAVLSNARLFAKRNGVDEIKVLTVLIQRLKEKRNTLAREAILTYGPGLYIKDIYSEEEFYDRWRTEGISQ